MNDMLYLKLLEPENVKMFNRQAKLYSQLEKCAKIQMDPLTCTGYEEYLNLTRKIEIMRTALYKNTPLSNIPEEKNCFKSQLTNGWKVSNAFNELTRLSSLLF